MGWQIISVKQGLKKSSRSPMKDKSNKFWPQIHTNDWKGLVLQRHGWIVRNYKEWKRCCLNGLCMVNSCSKGRVRGWSSTSLSLPGGWRNTSWPAYKKCTYTHTVVLMESTIHKLHWGTSVDERGTPPRGETPNLTYRQLSWGVLGFADCFLCFPQSYPGQEQEKKTTQN